MKLRVTDLTFIAEDLGRRVPAPLRYLAVLSRHPSPIVREGAVYGMAMQLEGMRARLEEMAATDPNEIIRNAAAEALEP